MGDNSDVPSDDFRVRSGPWLLLGIPEPRLLNHERRQFGMKALRLDEPDSISTGEEVMRGGVIGESIGAGEGKLSDILENLAPTEAADVGESYSVLFCCIFLSDSGFDVMTAKV